MSKGSKDSRTPDWQKRRREHERIFAKRPPCPSDCQCYNPNIHLDICIGCDQMLYTKDMIHISPYIYNCKPCSNGLHKRNASI